MFRKSRIKIIISIMSIMALLLAGTFGIIYYSSYRDITAKNLQMLERYVGIYSENGEPEGYQNGSEDKKTIETKSAESNPAESNPAESNQTESNPAESNPAESKPAEPEKSGSSEPLASPPQSEHDNQNPPPQPEDDNQNPPPQPEDDKRMYDAAVFYSVKFLSDGTVDAVDNSSTSVTDDDLTATAESVLKENKDKGKKDGYSFLVDKNDDYTLVVFLDSTDFDSTFSTLIRYTLIFSAVSLVAIFLIALWLSKLIIRPLEQSHELQRQFISDAGHELKTPVAVIDTNAEVLSAEIGENKWLSNIRYENNRMSLLIKELLSLVKAEKAEESGEQVDFSRVVIGEILPFEGVAFEKGMEINCEMVEDNIFVKGNPSRLGQVVSILVDNAISYSYPNTDIDVSLTRDRGKAVLSITNSADEISEEKAKHIFDRFYRIDDARTDGGHYGLGLSIAKSIVEAHGGEISVKSNENKVTFTVAIKI